MFSLECVDITKGHVWHGTVFSAQAFSKPPFTWVWTIFLHGQILAWFYLVFTQDFQN